MLEKIFSVAKVIVQACGPDVMEELGTRLGGPTWGHFARQVAEAIAENVR
jgi:hypothetical protein